MLKKARRGVLNKDRVVFLVLLVAVSLLGFSRLIFSADPQISEALASDAGTLNWAGFDFSGQAYASNGDGQFDRYASCFNSSLCTAGSLWDLRGVWVTQDANFLAWKITGNNFSTASFCGGTSGIRDLGFVIEFDADGNASTGCRNGFGYEDQCYPGTDYMIEVRRGGNGTLYSFNGSLLPSSCTSTANCFNNSAKVGNVWKNLSVYVNISKNSNGVCDSNASSIKIAVNRTQLNYSVLTFNAYTITDSSHSPIDLLGANRQEFSSFGFGGGDFFEEGGNFSFMFRGGGCESFTNQSYCQTPTDNGNFNCVWESDFSSCRGNFTGSSNYGCADFCGDCSTEGTCNTGARSTCKWTGSYCIEDFDKFRYGGSCDNSCGDCFGQAACTSSKVSGGCSWITDHVRGQSFCGSGGTTIKNCGPDTEATSCFNCNATGCISSANAGLCAFDNTSNFCYYNVAGKEYSCFDGLDNDGDSKVDCKDSDCSSDKFCGGGEFDKKILTDIFYITKMKILGVCKDSSSGLSCDKEKALLFESAEKMGDKPGPPLKLKDDDTPNNEPPAAMPHLNMLGFGFKDMGKSIGMGMMLQNGSASAVCPNSTNGTGMYYFYLDIDSSASTGCWDMINLTNVSGIEYKFVYNVSLNASTYLEKRSAFRCLKENTTSFGLFPAKLTSPVNPFNPSQTPMCSFGAAIMVVPLEDIGNPKTPITYHLATVDNVTGSANLSNDTIFNATYTPGTVDYYPPDCEKNALACGTAFSKLGGGRFTPFEDCALGSPDEDQDGTANCNDVDCAQVPWCSANRATLLANDKTAPRVLSNIIDEFDGFALLRQSTSEPSNMSIEFYNTTGTCIVSLANLSDSISGGAFEIDRYKPWHGITFDNTTITDSSMVPLKANTTYYYRIRNCDLSNNCAISACLNFTTKTSGVKNFNFGIIFDAKSTAMSGLNLTYWNGSHNVGFSIKNISYISNTTLRFDNYNTTFNGTTKPYNIQFEGVDIAKATSINMTDMMIMTQVNETGLTGGSGSNARMLVGMNGTKWQEMAQLLGIDSVIVNISQIGNRVIKCDINGSNCIDVTANITVLKQGSNYTTIKIPTYGLGGFSAYGVNNSGVLVSSDRTAYQCFPRCTLYFNVTNYQSNYSQVFNLTIKVNDTAAKANYNISYLNLSNLTSGWVWLSSNNQSNLTNYFFNITDSARQNITVHQFRIDVNMSIPIAEKVDFNITVTNNTGFTASWGDTVWLDNINITNPEDDNISTDVTPDISFRLLTLNDTVQECTLRINGTSYVNSSVFNASSLGSAANITTFTVNKTLANGTYTYNITCLNSESNDAGNSSVRTLRITDTTKPLFNSTPTSSSPSTSGITISWSTDERTNTSPLSRGTSQTSFNTNHTETDFSTFHSIGISGLTAGTTYYYNVTACDNAGNCNTTGPLSFTTSSEVAGGGGSSGGGGAGGGASPTATDKVSRVWADLPTGISTMNIAKVEIAVRKILIETVAGNSNAELAVSKLKSAPSETGSAPGTAYQYLEFAATNIVSSTLKSVTIQFNVEHKWLDANGIVKDKVSLYRYSGGKWTELPTKITLDEGPSVSYEAVSPGFSTFAISGSSKAKPAASGNESEITEVTGASTTAAGAGANQSGQAGEEGTKPKTGSTIGSVLESIKSEKMVTYIAIGIVALAILGVIGYFISRGRGGGGGKAKAEGGW